MEFLVGFLLGGACVLYGLVRWANNRSVHKEEPTNHPPNPIFDDVQQESEAFLRELRKSFADYAKKRR